MTRLSALGIGLALAAPMILTPGAARAADPPRAGASKGQTAAALFYEARALMQKGQYTAACPKLEESLRIDYGIGTEFNLAECNELVGKTAAAFAGFQSVAAAARSAKQPERERIARERAKALEPKLAVPAVVVPATTRVTLAPPPPSPPAVAAVAPRAQPPESVAMPVSTTETTSAPLSPGEPAPARGSAQRTLGYVAGGVGLAGLGVAGLFGLDSISKRNRSKPHCNGNLCDAEGISLRDDAMQSGTAATVATVAGVAALVGGLVLLVTAPSKPERSTARSAVPLVAVGGGGVTLQGILP